MAKLFDTDKDVHKIKLKKTEAYKGEISGFGGVSSNGLLLGSLGGHGLNFIDELEEKEVRLILEVVNTGEMREMLNPKNGLEKKIEDEIESRMGAKGMIAKLERELTERELEEIKELREMVEKELKEGKRKN